MAAAKVQLLPYDASLRIIQCGVQRTEPRCLGTLLYPSGKWCPRHLAASSVLAVHAGNYYRSAHSLVLHSLLSSTRIALSRVSREILGVGVTEHYFEGCQVMRPIGLLVCASQPMNQPQGFVQFTILHRLRNGMDLRQAGWLRFEQHFNRPRIRRCHLLR